MAHGGGGESSALCRANGMFKKSHVTLMVLSYHQRNWWSATRYCQRRSCWRRQCKDTQKRKSHKCLEKTSICKVEAITITDHCDAGKSECSPCTSSYLYLLFCKKDMLEVLCSFLTCQKRQTTKTKIAFCPARWQFLCSEECIIGLVKINFQDALV